MKSEDIQKLIPTLESELAKKNADLDALIEEFRTELAILAEPWMKKKVEYAIEGHSKEFEKFSIEKVQALKNEVRGLFSRLPEIAREETKDKGDWPHNRAADESGHREGKNEPFFNNAYRNVISHIASVLDRYGLLTVPEGYAQEWNRIGEGRFRYGFNPGFQDLKIASLNRYDAALFEWKKIKDQLEKANSDLSRAKAKELWDSA